MIQSVSRCSRKIGFTAASVNSIVDSSTFFAVPTPAA